MATKSHVDLLNEVVKTGPRRGVVIDQARHHVREWGAKHQRKKPLQMLIEPLDKELVQLPRQMPAELVETALQLLEIQGVVLHVSNGLVELAVQL